MTLKTVIFCFCSNSKGDISQKALIFFAFLGYPNLKDILGNAQNWQLRQCSRDLESCNVLKQYSLLRLVLAGTAVNGLINQSPTVPKYQSTSSEVRDILSKIKTSERNLPTKCDSLNSIWCLLIFQILSIQITALPGTSVWHNTAANTYHLRLLCWTPGQIPSAKSLLLSLKMSPIQFRACSSPMLLLPY